MDNSKGCTEFLGKFVMDMRERIAKDGPRRSWESCLLLIQTDQ